MARPATGQVLERQGKRGRTFAIRFRAYGQRQYVTTAATTRAAAAITATVGELDERAAGLRELADLLQAAKATAIDAAYDDSTKGVTA